MSRLDLIALIGVALLVGGVAWIYPPAALVLAGVLTTTAAVLIARGILKSQERREE